MPRLSLALPSLLLIGVLAGCQTARLTQFKKAAQTEPSVTVSSSAEGKRSPLEPCLIDDECASGFCVAIAGQKQCAARCAGANECPGGLVCKRADARDPSSPSICVEKSDQLCHPCQKDDDCGDGDQCVGEADGSTTCARDCSIGGDQSCPSGYRCAEQKDGEGKETGKQCVPVKGTCACSEQTRGQTRPCEKSNEHGTCSGNERCEPGAGYVGCDAPAAQAEACDAADNNCNGLVDENPAAPSEKLTAPCGNGIAACIGVATCRGGTYTDCTAPSPAPEQCNGLDDNCDGRVDEDLLASPDACGSCGNVCPPGPALAYSTGRSCSDTASGYACGPITCRGGYYDTDHNPVNGCETLDDAPAHGDAASAWGANRGGATCEIYDAQNEYCEFKDLLFPSDLRQHEVWPSSRQGPVGVNAIDWFKIRAFDQWDGNLQIRAYLDVSALPPQNLYELCQTGDDDNLGSMPTGCGARPGSDATWCNPANQFCCCAYGGNAVGTPLSAGDTDPYGPSDDGIYYARVRWLSGTGVSAASYQVRLCDDSGERHCSN